MMSSESIVSRQISKSDTTPKPQYLIAVRNPIERAFFRLFIFIIPVVYLFRAIVELIYLAFPYALTDYVKIISELALIAALVFANLFFTAIPGVISQLFVGKNLLPKAPESDQENTSYELFISRFDFWLNHKFRILFGALETFYQAHEEINTWPVNKQVLIGIWTTQTILWGQVVGLYNLATRFLS